MNTRIEQLLQIFDGKVWDGDLISKHDRDVLFEYGLITRHDNYNYISQRGIKLCIILGLRDGEVKPITIGGGRWA